jgi:hypothetical protein
MTKAETPTKSASSTKSAPPPSEPWDVIEAYVDRYRSEHLTDEQSERLGPRLKQAVRKQMTDPIDTKLDVRHRDTVGDRARVPSRPNSARPKAA